MLLFPIVVGWDVADAASVTFLFLKYNIIICGCCIVMWDGVDDAFCFGSGECNAMLWKLWDIATSCVDALDGVRHC